MESRVKCETSNGKNEEKGEYGSSWNESLRFKCGTPIMLRPFISIKVKNNCENYLHWNIISPKYETQKKKM